MILIPALGALAQAFLPAVTSRTTALAASVAAALVGFITVFSLETGSADAQFIDLFAWIGSYGVHYDVAVDGLNALLLLAISLIFPILIASEWEQKMGGRGVFALLLLLQSIATGAATSRDLFVLFFFWAAMPVPIYFLNLASFNFNSLANFRARSLIFSSFLSALRSVAASPLVVSAFL